MSDTKLFVFNDQKLTIVMQNDQPYFIVKEVCNVLEHTNSRKAIQDLCDTEDVTTGYIPHPQSPTKQLQVNLVNEGGLYALIFGSRLETAKVFKKWVTSEVLPSIRKHGMYATPETLLTPDNMIRAMEAIKRERAEKNQALQQLQVANTTIQQQESKVLFAETVGASKHSILVKELAAYLTQGGYRIGQNKLFEKLRADGYLCKKGSYYNLPTQMALNLGLFEVKKSTITQPETIIASTTTKVTGKGQVYFLNKFLKSASQSVAA